MNQGNEGPLKARGGDNSVPPHVPVDDMVVSQAVTGAQREYMDAVLIPKAEGGNEMPGQAATEVILETGASNTQNVREKAVSGAKVMGLRTAISFALRIISSLTLSHFLFANDYGLFGAAAGIAGLGQYFCDVGVGSVLVMQEREPTEDEVTTIFWLQQAVTGVVVVLILLCIPLLLSLYKAPTAAGPILAVMTLCLFPASLRVIPVMQLERELNFGQQAKAEMIENFSQVGVNLLMAVLHFGAWALVGGTVTARIVGLIAVWRVAPWRPRGRFRMDLALRFIGQGTQFQANVIAPTLISSAYPVLISRLLGLGALGFLNWSANIASVPMQFSSVLNRVAFPAMNRLQSDPEEMGRVTTVLVRRISTALSVCFAPVVIFSPLFIPLLFGQRWLPAVPLFQWAIMDTINLVVVGFLATAVSIGGFLTRRLIAAVGGGLMKLVFIYVALLMFGLSGAGFGGYLGTLVEMAILGGYAYKYVVGCRQIAQDILLPIIGVQGAAALGLAVAYFAFGANHPATLINGMFSSLIAFGIFLLGLALYDSLGKKKAVRDEISGIIRLFTTRKAVV